MDEAERRRARIRMADTLRRESEWRRLNEGLWESEVEGFALNEAARGRKFSMGQILQRLRSRDRTDAEGRTAGVNDHFGPIWVRMLLRDHPALEGFVEVRRTLWDEPEATRSIGFGDG